MSALVPFCENVPCPMCGFVGTEKKLHAVTYCAGPISQESGSRKLCGLAEPIREPHLHVACGRCRFVWPMGPKGKPQPPKPR